MKIRITGVKEIDRALADFGKKEANKILRSSMRYGLQPTLKKVRQLAPKGVDRKIRRRPHKAGSLRKSFKIRSAKRSRKNKGTITVRVAASARDYVGDQFYAPMVNWGTVKMEGRFFMQRAQQATEGLVVERTRQRARELINQRLKWWRRI